MKTKKRKPIRYTGVPTTMALIGNKTFKPIRLLTHYYDYRLQMQRLPNLLLDRCGQRVKPLLFNTLEPGIVFDPYRAYACQADAIGRIAKAFNNSSSNNNYPPADTVSQIHTQLNPTIGSLFDVKYFNLFAVFGVVE